MSMTSYELDTRQCVINRLLLHIVVIMLTIYIIFICPCRQNSLQRLQHCVLCIIKKTFTLTFAVVDSAFAVVGRDEIMPVGGYDRYSRLHWNGSIAKRKRCSGGQQSMSADLNTFRKHIVSQTDRGWQERARIEWPKTTREVGRASPELLIFWGLKSSVFWCIVF